MAFSTFIVYFKPSSSNVNREKLRGLWITAVSSKNDGDDYVANASNVTAVTDVYGDGTLSVSAATVTIPNFAQPYFAYYHDSGDADGTIIDTPQYTGYSTAIHRLRTELRRWHNRLHELYGLLTQIGPNYPQTDVDLGHSILYRLHQGTYLVARDTNITLANRLTWLAASAQGPADTAYDPNDPETFFEIAAAITSSTLRNSTHPLEVAASEDRQDVGGVTSADFDFGDRLTIAQMLDSNHAPTGTAPTVAQLKRGGWIEEVTS